jgi:hypothetical protein
MGKVYIYAPLSHYTQTLSGPFTQDGLAIYCAKTDRIYWAQSYTHKDPAIVTTTDGAPPQDKPFESFDDKIIHLTNRTGRGDLDLWNHQRIQCRNVVDVTLTDKEWKAVIAATLAYEKNPAASLFRGHNDRFLEVAAASAARSIVGRADRASTNDHGSYSLLPAREESNDDLALLERKELVQRRWDARKLNRKYRRGRNPKYTGDIGGTWTAPGRPSPSDSMGVTDAGEMHKRYLRLLRRLISDEPGWG